MRQFDIFANPSGTSDGFAPYVLVLQSHLLDAIETVVVAPLVRDAMPALSPLDIPVSINGEDLCLSLGEISNVERHRLRRTIANMVQYEDQIRRGLERLFTGF